MKKQRVTDSGFFNPRTLAGSMFCLTGILLGIIVLRASPDQLAGSPAGSNAHMTWNSEQQQPLEPARQMNAEELSAELATTPPTRGTFMANWKSVDGATGYQLDVSTSSSFTSYVKGYQDLDVGNTIGTVVTGLEPGTTYYYRVRAYTVGEKASASSETAAVTTAAATGLIIHPTFDTSITGNAQAAAIEATINRAISMIEHLYNDPITVQIRYRYATTRPDGTVLPSGNNASSQYGLGIFPWNTYENALRADAKTSNDNVANPNLPPSPPPGITSIVISTANGRALGLNTPPNTFANGTNGTGGPYDGIVTLNSSNPFRFTRPAASGQYDAQRSLEHEMDEVMGLGTYHDCPYCQNNAALRPQDLFSWSSPGVRSNQVTGLRYFSINGGNTRTVDFNQQSGDKGDWVSPSCPQPHPYVQNAILCQGQSSDVTATSPEGINLDVTGYDLGSSVPAAAVRYDFNRDTKPDYLLYRASLRQTAIWYMNNNARITSKYGPTLPSGWKVVDVADFNGDGKQDYLLYNASTQQSSIWYLNNYALASGAFGPTLPSGWTLVAAGDFNGDKKPDYVIYNPSTHQTVIWYMNNNVFVQTVFGPTLPVGYRLVGVVDFNRDGKPDYLIFHPNSGRSAIWTMSGPTRIGGAFGPTIPRGYSLVGAADFDRDGKPDYVLFAAGNLHTTIWYLTYATFVRAASGPTLPVGWTLVEP